MDNGQNLDVPKVRVNSKKHIIDVMPACIVAKEPYADRGKRVRPFSLDRTGNIP